MPITEKFLPIASVGDKALLMTNTGYYLVDVTWVEPVPLLEVTTNTITNGSTLTREMTEIYVEDNEFAQWRMKIATTGVKLVAHNAPEAGTYYSTKNATGEIPDASSYTDNVISYWQLTEFYQFKDITRKMKFENDSGSDTTATLDFYGYIYVFANPVQYSRITDVPKPYVPVPVVARNARATGGT